ncbi:MAG: N-acetylmuramoyl-L-alanine amidase [Gemmatimonadota bacterium]|nr:N-acetylmuramoyl-L-alanine amidase [Gemmatimonadota bacterium]
MRPICRCAVVSVVLPAVAACAPARPAMAPAPAPPLTLTVVYPPLTADSGGWRAIAPLGSADSTFVFGSVSRPDAVVRVNGVPAAVAATGGWLAWLGLPADTVAVVAVVASREGERTEVRFSAALPQRYRPPGVGAWIDTTSLEPTGSAWLRPGEGVRLRVRAAPEARVQLRVGDSTVVPFVRDAALPALPWGERAFGTVPPAPRAPAPDRFSAWWVGPLGSDPGAVLAPAPGDTSDASWPVLEVTLGDDTARTRWPLRAAVLPPEAPTVAIVNDDTAGTGTTDRQLAGRPAPHATYHWFFPNGTRAVVSGRRNDQVRLQLSQRAAAWVDARDVQPLPPGTPPPGGATQALRLVPGPASVVLRIPLPGMVPFRVDEDAARVRLTLYGVAANADWIQYGGTDPLVTLIRFAVPAEDETEIVVELAEPVWGYRTWWSGHDLLLEIRRPPAIDRRHPLRGRVIALDPGHPPGGATGPTGLYEGDAVLAVAREAERLFAAAGARVVLLRTDGAPLGLVERVTAAEAADADVLLSIHANALPDGVNPFVNHGTSVYYFHPRSASLARHVNRALVGALGVRDLGMGRGDLALARPTWMPAVLTEGLFMMIPEQEALLRDPDGRRRYARGLVEGTAAFLAERADAR